MLEKYYRGTCSQEEENAVLEWMNSTDESEDILKGVPFSSLLEERLRSRIRKAMANEAEGEKNNILNRFKWLLAASITLFIGLAAFFWFFKKDTRYQTQVGERQAVTLDDGTEVFLNAASKLKVPLEFGGETRSVWLEGEAFFKVKKDSLRPFIIHTEASITKVLGTQFNLSAYADEPLTLTLSEGKVAFSKKGNDKNPDIILFPNQQVILKNGSVEKRESNPYFSQAWMEKKLVFRGASFLEVAREIERFYGITIKIEKEGLEERLYRGTHDNPSLQALMQKLSFVLKFKYKIEGQTLIIY